MFLHFEQRGLYFRFCFYFSFYFFFSSRRRHTRSKRDWSSDVCSSDLHSHRFPGANTALPYVNGDETQLATVQNFLRDGQISLDIFGLSRTAATVPQEVKKNAGAEEPQLSTTFATGEESSSFGAPQAFIAPPVEVIAPLDKVEAVVKRGESV